LANVYFLSAPCKSTVDSGRARGVANATLCDDDGSPTYCLPIASFSSVKRAFEWASEWAFDHENNVWSRQDAIGKDDNLSDEDLAVFKLYGPDSTEYDMGKIKSAFRGKPGSSIELTDNTGSVKFAITYMQTL
jgi:hypothetical protein